jgi:hypothetical protein
VARPLAIVQNLKNFLKQCGIIDESLHLCQLRNSCGPAVSPSPNPLPMDVQFRTHVDNRCTVGRHQDNSGSLNLPDRHSMGAHKTFKKGALALREWDCVGIIRHKSLLTDHDPGV